MHTVAEIADVRQQIQQCRQSGLRISFIPTMGDLHDGHISLIKAAKERAEIVVVSIFANPLQYDNPEEAVPLKNLESDQAKLIEANVDILYTPSTESLYPNGFDLKTYVGMPDLFQLLDNSYRPNYFRGVATATLKLLNIVQPDMIVLGKKNYQHLTIIRQMITDLSLNIDVVTVPIVRDMDGVAISYRNEFLTIDERQRAPVVARTIRWVSSQIRGGRNDYQELVLDATDQLRAAGFYPKGITICDAYSLLPVSSESNKLVILMKASIGHITLTDNLSVDIVSKEELTEAE
ncbi:pantoate--beta-alanine ligase [Vibrio sp. SS-MA-C1-2]|uniref:pantoate--beta-alanine ligase n=1 Tax=Vibrio sp. SS-MA-C1-2 TaxID=2908646 RepID=UPI001F197F07|nr:pantoate--beta-alanine ligase [Vibrio sp. SS-MA-C1-2]UJF19640.1 pantoate--beta-alanine ligase [Vibrio sp. SS-MA-C1-2]